MSHPRPSSPWRLPLVRELAAILLIKLALLLGIRALWFNEPTLPVNGTQRTSDHLFTPAPTAPPVSSSTPSTLAPRASHHEEEPR
ncbi:MAG: cytochrome oxidase putative small subunit CydP [Pseudomonas sp.]